jgi:AcrR family transcriptional regulator
VMNDVSPIAKTAMPAGERTAASRSSYASRHDRRRLETRARLLRALMKLLARKSLPDIAIHEITEVADVGGGTFYNHFTDRASIHDAMMTELVTGWSDIVGAAAPLAQDAAETLAVRMRLYITRAGQDRDWAEYVVSNAFKEMIAQSPIWQRVHDLVDHGRKQGRFTHAEPMPRDPGDLQPWRGHRPGRRRRSAQGRGRGAHHDRLCAGAARRQPGRLRAPHSGAASGGALGRFEHGPPCAHRAPGDTGVLSRRRVVSPRRPGDAPPACHD